MPNSHAIGMAHTVPQGLLPSRGDGVDGHGQGRTLGGLKGRRRIGHRTGNRVCPLTQRNRWCESIGAHVKSLLGYVPINIEVWGFSCCWRGHGESRPCDGGDVVLLTGGIAIKVRSAFGRGNARGAGVILSYQIRRTCGCRRCCRCWLDDGNEVRLNLVIRRTHKNVYFGAGWTSWEWDGTRIRPLSIDRHS